MAHTGSGVAARGSVTRALTKASRSNFYYAFLFLPRQKREALYAIYAFCRLTDDLVDEMPSAFSADHHHQADPDPSPSTDTSVGVARAPGTPLQRLKAWRAELGACFRGEATHPVTQRLAEVNQDLRIPRAFSRNCWMAWRWISRSPDTPHTPSCSSIAIGWRGWWD